MVYTEDQSYQFPMGKVKLGGKIMKKIIATVSIPYGKGKGKCWLVGVTLCLVSIPYGKGKAKSAKANNKFAKWYQFPMGKVKMRTVI